MNRRLFALLLVIFPGIAFAAGGGYPLDHMTPNLDDKASLQRGAQTYMNYCLGSVSYTHLTLPTNREV